MSICFSLTDLKPGGAQVFVVRLASELAERSGKQVFVYDHWPEFRHPGILQNIHPLVEVVSYSDSKIAHWLIWKMNAAMKLVRPGYDYRHSLNRRRFLSTLKKHKITVLNSHMAASDFLISSLALPPACRLVLTLHGEYELLLNETNEKEDYIKKIRGALQKSSAIIYTAKKNLEPVQDLFPHAATTAHKINIGFNPSRFRRVSVSRKQLGLSENDFVIGMVSRGILAKGWDTALQTLDEYNKTADEKAKLICIGNGEYLKDLVAKANNPDIILLQFEENFQDYFSWYAIFDLFIFPSRFDGESMPNVIIESLYWKVPVVASAIAEIPQMLRCNSASPAGICVEEITASRFAAAVSSLVRDRQKLAALRANCSAAYADYDMAGIAANYEAVFARVAENQENDRG